MQRILLFAWASVLLFACQKDYNREPGVETYASYETAMATEAPKTKHETINAAAGGNVRGHSGTRYSFQPNSFVTQNGVPVSGEVDIEMKECLTRADMVFSGMLPVAADGPLESGGEALVLASQNGEALRMAPGASYEIMLPKTNSATANDMSLFLGEEDPVTRLLNWQAAADSLGSVASVGDSFRVQTIFTGYVNADKYYRFNPCFVSLKLQYRGMPVSDSFSVYVIVAGRNIIYRANKPENGVAKNVKVQNADVYFLALGFFENSLCACAIKPPITQGATYTMDVEKMTPAKLKALLNSM